MSEEKPIMSNLDKVISVLGIITIVAFPLIFVSSIWIRNVPRTELMGLDIVLFIGICAYFRIKMKKELKDRKP